ncbi:MAG: hypothetical protein OXB86_05025 [Bdellovibrionales bacterium]|nr:hypothetical protein [Bdellovibrionales bacterium]
MNYFFKSIPKFIFKFLMIGFVFFQTIPSLFAGELYFLSERDMISYVQSGIWKLQSPDATRLGFFIKSNGISGIVTTFQAAQDLSRTGGMEDITLVNGKDNSSRRVKSFRFDALNGLALIETMEGDDERSLQIRDEQPSKNEKVFLIGSSHSSEQFIETSNISPIRFDEDDDLYSFYVGRNNILSRAGGGPAFNSMGHVVGVFTQGVSNHAREVVGLQHLKKFIGECDNASHCIKEELENLKKMAQEEGNFIAQFKWAEILYYGIGGMKRDREQALELYKKSYQGSNKYGRGIAAVRIGTIYFEKDDHEQAKRWFKDAVQAGNPEGELSMGALTQDESWFRKSAQDGFIASQRCRLQFRK